MALVSKSGSRGKIQERCCQGLIAARASHQCTVEVGVEIDSTRPRVTASVANSVLLQRDNGIPVSAGRVQASA